MPQPAEPAPSADQTSSAVADASAVASAHAALLEHLASEEMAKALGRPFQEMTPLEQLGVLQAQIEQAAAECPLTVTVLARMSAQLLDELSSSAPVALGGGAAASGTAASGTAASGRETLRLALAPATCSAPNRAAFDLVVCGLADGEPPPQFKRMRVLRHPAEPLQVIVQGHIEARSEYLPLPRAGVQGGKANEYTCTLEGSRLYVPLELPAATASPVPSDLPPGIDDALESSQER